MNKSKKASPERAKSLDKDALMVGPSHKTVEKTSKVTTVGKSAPSSGFYRKQVFDFVQRKVEYENFRFKYPTLIGIVLETLPTQLLEKQKDIGVFNFRFHISQSLTLGEIGEVLKFKI